MIFRSKSIRTFIGAKNYQKSRSFYTEIGFEEFLIDSKMSLFKINEDLSFYLQDSYVEEWVNNTILFLEVTDLDRCFKDFVEKDLPSRYPTVRISKIKEEEWGREFFMHDPSGILWHFGIFNA